MPAWNADEARKRAEAAQRERATRFLMFRRLFTSPDGAKVLDVLERLTRDRIRPDEGAPIDPYQLAVLHGRREVVQFIRDQIAAAEKEGTNDAD